MAKINNHPIPKHHVNQQVLSYISIKSLLLEIYINRIFVKQFTCNDFIKNNYIF